MRKRAIALATVLLLLGNASFALAAAGSVEAGFNPAVPLQRLAGLNSDGTIDKVFDMSAGPDGDVHAMVVQPDGKILIAGRFTTVDGVPRNHLARLNAVDGTVDTGFDSGVGVDGDIEAMALQPDGKILIGGGFTSVDGIARGHIARLDADGSLDGAFASATGTDGFVGTIALQPDGKILIGGGFSSVNDVTRFHLARLNGEDGSLDASFDPPGGVDDEISAFALQPDGKILIGGIFTTVAGTARQALARLNGEDGSLDTAFDAHLDSTALVFTLALQPDGKILIGGKFADVNGTERNSIARLQGADGALDTGFDHPIAPGTDGTAVRSIIVQPDGKILVAGDFGRLSGLDHDRIARLSASGDTDFGFGAGLDGSVFTLALRPDGKVLAGGSFSHYSASGPDFGVSRAVLQPDGKALIFGVFAHVDGLLRPGIARLNAADGSVDPSFVGPGFVDSVHTLALQPDGKILIGGFFTQVGGVRRNNIARLNADGSLDASFDPTGIGTNGDVIAIGVQSDGKILIGGSFTTVGGVTRNNFARLRADGSLDADFDDSTNADFSGTVDAVLVQPDGKILIGGRFTTVGGVTRNRVARINSTDGSIDAAFDPGTGANNSVFALALQRDGRILIGGPFSTVGGKTRVDIARLNGVDGSLDASFVPDAIVGPNNQVDAIVVQPDGKVILAGTVNTVAGASRNGIARLNADGTLDAGFDPGTGALTGAFGAVFTLALQPDGKLLAGGSFKAFDGVTHHAMARLDAEAPQPNILITGTSDGTAVSESGGTDTFTVALAARPLADVALDVVSGAIGTVTVAPASLTFTDVNWNVPQVVTVTGVDDVLRNGTRHVGVTVAVRDASSSDEYADVPDTVVSVEVLDNESGGGGTPLPEILLASPNGGEALHAGEVKNVFWTYRGQASNAIRLELSTDGGQTYPTVVTDDAGANGVYAWTVPDISSFSARLRASMLYFGSPTASDTSDADFVLIGSGVSGLPRTGSGTGSAPVFIPSGSINEDKGLTASATGSTPGCVSDSLVKTSAASAVYYCGADGKRYVFPNEKIYFSWYPDFSKVQTVDSAVMASLPIGGNVTYKPGVRMIKVESDPKAYIVSRKGVLRWVPTEEIATKLYGPTWSKMIDDLSVSLFTDYVVSQPISAAEAGSTAQTAA